MKALEKWNKLNDRISVLCQQGSQGWYIEAANLAEEAVKFAEKEFGANHPNFADALEKIALIYHLQGKYVEQLLFEQKLTSEQKNVLLPDDPAFEQPPNTLVLRHLAKRKYKRAEFVFKQALAIKEKIFRPDYPDVLKTLGNLAELYNSQGRYAEAESLFRSIWLYNAAPSQISHISSSERKSADFTKT